ncbi:MAG TPA: ribosome-associated translation inhibitor RaiA [Limnobacter sp.]|uniref:ribosome hibernation-promoting factor, HPF/YfiA family n=1 Tax=Limnobacter sp. TaxID=2003368 RepID=UPI002E364EF0|nr:ribosome-associated translation inhibitor RaiA [Limnobacter sp.]HEX5485926.1 ribosome-associated translation inhibitor RaiA [Limnobacter sp.]
MNLNINGHHLEVTPAIRSYVIEKLDRIKRHFDHVIDASVTLSVIKLVQRAEITLHVRGRDIHAEAHHENLYAAIDALADKIDRQVLRHKDKVTNHNHVPVKHQPAEAATE